jgi:Tol biopolymer transport system component
MPEERHALSGQPAGAGQEVLPTVEWSNSSMPVETDRLDSWKQIAAYLQKSERTVRRWHETEGLPVHKHQHQQRGSVWAYASEIDAWRQSRVLSPLEPDPETSQSPPTKSPKTAHAWKWAIAGGVTLLVLSSWVLLGRRQAPASPVEWVATPFTALPGDEHSAAFSPDGKTVVFSYTGSPDAKLQSGLYFKALDGDDLTPLIVGDDLLRYSPAWSPLGDRIAYVDRNSKGETRLMWIPVSGGNPHEIAKLGLPLTMENIHASWSLDGRWLYAGALQADGRKGIFRFDPDHGDAVQITRRDGQAGRDIAPTLSPDGRTLAFVRDNASIGYLGVVQIATVPAAVSEPLAEPMIVDSGRFRYGGLAWAPSGKELLFCTGTPSSQPARTLYRLTLDKPTRRTPVISDNCHTVAVARPASDGTAQLIYGTFQAKSEIFRLLLDGKSQPKPFARSTRYDTRPAYSFDGRQVAFLSSRTGLPSFWIADADGSNPHRIELKGLTLVGEFGGMRPSPDDKEWVFAADRGDDVTRVFTLHPGSKPVEIAVGHCPSFSRDGEWIFFSAQAADGTYHGWRIRRRVGAVPEKITKSGAYLIYEAPGGKSVLTIVKSSPSVVREVPLDGGPEIERMSLALRSPFGVTQDWIYYGVTDGDGRTKLLRTRNFSSKPERVAEIGVRVDFDFDVAPDGKELIYSVGAVPPTDLMLIRRFH